MPNANKKARRRIGGDVYLSPSPPDAGGEWRVDIGFTVPGWKATTRADPTLAPLPGTAILISGRWFEIYRFGPLDGAPHRTAYDLWPWDDTQVIRTAFELTPEACDDLTRRYRNQQHRIGAGGLLGLFPALTGLLPADDQKRLETEYGVPAPRATMISAVLLLGLSTAVIMISFALGRGMDFGESHELVIRIAAFAPLAGYLFLESILRMGSANGKEPMGTLPICLPLYLLRSLLGMGVPREQPEEKRATKPPAAGLFTARDRVRPLDHPEYDLEVISRLPKDHWTANVTGIEYQGEAYLLIERELLETQEGTRHRFLLQKPRDNVLFKQYVHYQPEEVRDIFRAQERAKTAPWVETFAFLWGFTSGPIQQRLARLYNYDPDRWTRGSIWTSAIVGVLSIVHAAGTMRDGGASAGTAVVLFGGIFLLWEAMVRRSKHRAGELHGSLLGVVFEPLAKRCLRWE